MSKEDSIRQIELIYELGNTQLKALTEALLMPLVASIVFMGKEISRSDSVQTKEKEIEDFLTELEKNLKEKKDDSKTE